VGHQLLVYADDVNLLRDNIHTIKKNIGTLIDSSKEFGLEVNAYLCLCCCLITTNAGQTRDIKISTDVLKIWLSFNTWEPPSQIKT
jgi:hypothetical protein